MGSASGAFSGRTSYSLNLATSLVSQGIVNNTSTLYWSLNITGPTGSYNLNNTSTWAINIDGQTASGTFSYDFRGTTTKALGSGYVTITHNPDGTRSYSASASSTCSTPLGSAGASFSEGLPTIPRATQPTVSPGSGNTGSAFTIGHSPASSSFYHDVFYSLDGGGSYTTLATNVPGTTTSTSWTPAHTLLPNSSGVTAVILVRTRASSGGTIIGDKTVNLPLTVPSTVVPTVSSVSWVDNQTASPDIPTLMGGAGRFVQRWSKLKPTVSSAGAGGSTIVGSSVTMAGQTTASGTAFSAAVNLSGAVPFTAWATDSRSRDSVSYVNTVAVTAYNFPNLPTPLVTRASDAAGNVPSPTGTYLAITPAASVSSLLFASVQKNLLEWQVRIKPAGGSYTTVQAWTSATVSGNTWTTKYVAAGPYASNTAWVVEVSIRDLFGKNGFNTASTVVALTVSVPSESVAFDWDGANGIGIGKYRTNGMLDVFGAIYQNNGMPVLDPSNLAIQNATQAQIDTGTAVSVYVSPSGLAGRLVTGTVSSIWSSGNPPVTLTSGPNSGSVVTATRESVGCQPGDSVTLEKVGSSYYIVANESTVVPFMKQIPISLQNGWVLYSDSTADAYGAFGQSVANTAAPASGSSLAGNAFATITQTGIVQLAGLLGASSSGTPTAAGTVMCTLPVGLRPARSQAFSVVSNNQHAMVYVCTDGTVRWSNTGVSGFSGTFVGLDSIRFRASGYGTFVALAPSNGSSSFVGSYGTGDTSSTKTAGYTTDSEGLIVFEGSIAGGTTTVNTNIQQITALGSLLQGHFPSAQSGGAFGVIRYGASGGVAGSGNYLNWGLAGSATWNSLSNILIVVTPVGWVFHTPQLYSSWAQYGSYQTIQIGKTPDGLVILRGLMNTGAIGSVSFWPSRGYWPRYQSILAAASNGALGRLDVSPLFGGPGSWDGAILTATGSTVWYSLDGLSYAAYR